MRKIRSQLGIIGFLICLAALLFISSCQPKPPTLEEAKEILNEDALVANSNCEGEFSVHNLAVVSVGEFNKQVQAYPIYASFKIQCKEGDEDIIFSGDESEIFAFLKHKKPRGFEIFIPAMP